MDSDRLAIGGTPASVASPPGHTVVAEKLTKYASSCALCGKDGSYSFVSVQPVLECVLLLARVSKKRLENWSARSKLLQLKILYVAASLLKP